MCTTSLCPLDGAQFSKQAPLCSQTALYQQDQIAVYWSGNRSTLNTGGAKYYLH